MISWNSVLNLPVYLKCPVAQSVILGNMVSTYIFLPDVVLPQNFDETKDQKIIHKDMKDSWNSVLDLLVYPKCPIK